MVYIMCAGISLGMCPANERCRYIVTTSLIGWGTPILIPGLLYCVWLFPSPCNHSLLYIACGIYEQVLPLLLCHLKKDCVAMVLTLYVLHSSIVLKKDICVSIFIIYITLLLLMLIMLLFVQMCAFACLYIDRNDPNKDFQSIIIS